MNTEVRFNQSDINEKKRRTQKQDHNSNMPHMWKTLSPQSEPITTPRPHAACNQASSKPYSLQIAQIRSKRCLNMSVNVCRATRAVHQLKTGTINRFIRFKAPQEQIECYQLGYRLIGLSWWSMMGQCNSGWHHIDSLGGFACKLSLHRWRPLGCTVAAFTERHPAIRPSVTAGRRLDLPEVRSHTQTGVFPRVYRWKIK